MNKDELISWFIDGVARNFNYNKNASVRCNEQAKSMISDESMGSSGAEKVRFIGELYANKALGCAIVLRSLKAWP